MMKQNKLKLFNINKKFYELLSVFLIGSFLFCLIYGFNAFKIFPQPFNDNDYLLYQASYYAFINSEFEFPIFYSDKLFVDKEINLIFGDYIPIYSLILKFLVKGFNIVILNPFMFWIYLNTLLTFYFSYKIFSLSSRLNVYENFLGATIISTLPLSPFKFLYHSGESTHFLIIAGIYLYLKSKQNVKYLYYLAVVTSLSLWVHLYLFAILSGILFVTSLKYIKLIKVILKTSSIFLVISSIIFYLSFESINLFMKNLENEIVTKFNPRWSAEFNSFFCSYNNPDFIYKFLKCYEPYTIRDLESYAYLGLGMITFLPIIFFKANNTKNLIVDNKSIVAVAVVFLFFSFGNRIKIAHKQILEYKFSSIHLQMIEIFRAHSRFVYLFYYLLAFLIIYKLFLVSKKKKIGFLIVFTFLVIQGVDLTRQYIGTDLNLYRIETGNNEIISASHESFVNLDNRLFIYPPDNCIENFDMYLFAKEFLKYGGSISSSRIRGGNSYENCQNINIYSNLLNYQPVHFLTTNSFFDTYKDLISSKYNCKIMDGVFNNEYIYYCNS